MVFKLKKSEKVYPLKYSNLITSPLSMDTLTKAKIKLKRQQRSQKFFCLKSFTYILYPSLYTEYQTWKKFRKKKKLEDDIFTFLKKQT